MKGNRLVPLFLWPVGQRTSDLGGLLSLAEV